MSEPVVYSGDPIVTSYYTKIGGTRSWEYKDKTNGSSAALSCTQPSSDRIQLAVKSYAWDFSFLFSVKEHGIFGQELTWLEAVTKGLGTVRWQNGLRLPYSWKPGDPPVSAQSEAEVPPVGHVTAAMTFKGFVQLKVPAWSPLPHVNGVYTPTDNPEINKLAVISIDMTLRSTVTSLAQATLQFAYGIGLAWAGVNKFGVFSVLELEKYTP